MTTSPTELPPYLDRPVTCAELTSVEAPLDDLQSFLVLVFLARDLSVAEQESLVRTLVDARPLSVCMCGHQAEDMFDRLLQALAVPDWALGKHIMTMFLETSLQESLEDFFYSSFPSEDRWDEWLGYKILVFGEDSARMYDLALQFLQPKNLD